MGGGLGFGSGGLGSSCGSWVGLSGIVPTSKIGKSPYYVVSRQT